MKKLITGVFCGVVLLWGGSWILIYSGFWGMEQRGQFGDMFGAVNSLFSGLAFAGVVIAIYMQSQELGLQRKELKLAREAQEKSEQALRAQVEQMQKTAELQALAALLTQLREATKQATVTGDRVRRLMNAQSATMDELVKMLPVNVVKTLQEEFPFGATTHKATAQAAPPPSQPSG